MIQYDPSITLMKWAVAVSLLVFGLNLLHALGTAA